MEIHMILFYLTIGGINFGHLVKFLYSRIFLLERYSLLLIRNLWGETEMCESPVSHMTFHMSFSCHWWFLPDSVITMMAANTDFSYCVIPSIFITCHSAVKNNFPWLSVWTSGLLFFSMGCDLLPWLFNYPRFGPRFLSPFLKSQLTEL